VNITGLPPEELDQIHKQAEQDVKPIIPDNFSGIVLVADVPYDEKAVFPIQNAHFGTVCAWLREADVRFDDCAVFTLLPFYPPNGVITFEHLSYVNSTITSIVALGERIKGLVLFGRQTLRHFRAGSAGVDEERGFPFRFHGKTALATYHPREVYLEYRYYKVVEHDVAKLVRFAREGWREPEFEINYQPSFADCVKFLNLLIERKPYISTDWETRDSAWGPYSIATCIAFAWNNKKAFVIPFERSGGRHYFSLDEEIHIWRKLAIVLETCPQVGHNAAHYDHWFAAYWCKILMHVVDDTMFAHWEVYTELDKSLAFCSSIYTDAPYWKNDLKLARAGKIPRESEFLYSGKDTCQTLAIAGEIANELKQLPPGVKQHYRFNIQVSRVFQYMSMRGCFIDRDKLAQRIAKLEVEAEIQYRKFHSEAGKNIKVTSPKQMKEWLYGPSYNGGLELPVKTKLVKLDDGSVEERETADFLSMLYLAREYPSIDALMTGAMLRKLLKRISSLKAIKLGPRGECYWGFGLVSTDSGRAAGYKPANGLGVQPQNVDGRDRDLFYAGYGKKWLKCDLEGADAWTVAGQLAVLGDETMLKDLKARLKPAQILALAQLCGEQYIAASQETLVALLKENKAFLKTPKGKGVYATAKAVSHGTNYMMQAPTMHVTVFKKSLGELYIPVRECENLRLLYLKRYRGLEELYRYIPTIINSDGYIDCPSGMRRVFLGRNDNHRTRVGLSLLPQNNTALATNRALLNLFREPYNRRQGCCELVVEPLNQVHDEADLAFLPEDLDQTRSIFQKASDFVSEIWGVQFRIPFDPNYGDTWGECEDPLYGED